MKVNCLIAEFDSVNSWINMKNSKILKIVLPILVAVISIIGIYLVASAMGRPGNDVITEAETVQYDGSTEAALTFTVVIVGATVAVIFLFFLFQLVTNFKKTSRLLVGLAVFALIFVVCYFVGSSLDGGLLTDKMATADPELTDSTVKWIEGGLLFTIALAGIAALMWIWGSVSKLLK